MKPLEVRTYLCDILQACELLTRFSEGKTFADCGQDPMLRSAVPASSPFRNRLIHGYASVSNEVVWGILENNLRRSAEKQQRSWRSLRTTESRDRTRPRPHARRTDAREVSTLHRIADLPRLIRLIAARNAGEFVTATVASQLGIPARTLPPYLRLLETVYLIHVIPAWSTNMPSRVVQRPKVALVDTALAARLVNASPRIPGTQAGAAGMILEGFVLGELRRQLSWTEEAASMYSFRDRNGAEIDVILETPDGRVVAIEVKGGASIRADDFRWMKQLRDRLGPRFVCGAVLHTGQEPGRFGDRLVPAPLSALWRPASGSPRPELTLSRAPTGRRRG